MFTKVGTKIKTDVYCIYSSILIKSMDISGQIIHQNLQELIAAMFKKISFQKISYREI